MKNNKNLASKVLKRMVQQTLKISASTRCVMGFHQPKQPKQVSRFRNF
ncbi:MAG TPA: cyclic lactone autoinducer peptide [Candidatus Eisenbergiella merdavium]|uniref:Cyclic lactone autoinducer peptide n=1 Tax=Candidatus Eisenbergiella merdavium TaxID=2838551 RepID=A0A9D2NFF5_9FIRM|nr:cyclic lactone autoinducer peptide [Candidatus Eisenbergiella merdavium]